MKFYIDKDFKCYTTFSEGRIEASSSFFDGKCKTFIEGYRFIPEGEKWADHLNYSFKGEMITPWQDYRVLASAQEEYEKILAEIQDMREALELLTTTEE